MSCKRLLRTQSSWSSTSVRQAAAESKWRAGEARRKAHTAEFRFARIDQPVPALDLTCDASGKMDVGKGEIAAYRVNMRRKLGTIMPIERSILPSMVHLQSQGVEDCHGILLTKEIAVSYGTRLLTGPGKVYRGSVSSMNKASWLAVAKTPRLRCGSAVRRERSISPRLIRSWSRQSPYSGGSRNASVCRLKHAARVVRPPGYGSRTRQSTSFGECTRPGFCFRSCKAAEFSGYRDHG